MIGKNCEHNAKSKSIDEKTYPSDDLSGIPVIEKKKALRDVAIIIIVNLSLLVLYVRLDVYEHFFEWSRRFEAWEIDEIVLMLVGVVFSLLWFSIQRWVSLKNTLKAIAHNRLMMLALSQAFLGIQQSQDPEEVLQITGEKIAGIGYHAQIFMLSDDHEHISDSYISFDPAILRISERSMGESIHDFRISITPGGFFDQLIAGGTAIFYENIDDILPEVISQSLLSKGRQIVSELGIKQAVYAPLNTGGKANGILGILGSGLSEDDKYAVAIFAGQIAIALEKAQLIKAAQEEIDLRKISEAEALRHQEILAGINQVLSARLTCETETDVARACLLVAEKLTGSKYGFICEMNHQGSLYSLAISDTGWEACQIPESFPMKLMESLENRGIRGKILKEERSIIFNDPTSHPEWIKTPEGHPRIDRFLGVPLKQGGRTIGMIALANKEEDYDLFDQEAIEDLSTAFVEAISSKRSELEIKRQLQEMTVLHAVAMAGTEALDEDQLIHSFTQTIGEMIYKDHFGILMLDEVGENLHPHPSYRGIDETHMQATIPLGKGISGRVAVTGQPWIVPDVSEEPTYREVSPHTGSELAVPLMASGRVHGVINVESNNVNAFSEQDERLLMTLAGQLSTAIAKIRVLQDFEKKSQQLTTIHKAAISITSLLDMDLLLRRLYEQVFDLFAPDAFLVALYDNQSEEIEIALAVEEEEDLLEWVGSKYDLLESGLTGWVIREQKSLLVGDIKTDTLPAKPKHGKLPSRTWLGVPLKSHGRVIGAISIQSFEKHAFDEDHQYVMETLGAQVAIAIENAELFAETKRRLNYLHSLQLIEEAITNNLDLNLTLKILLGQTTSCLGVDAADVLLFNSATNLLEFQAGQGFHTAALKHSRLQLGEGYAGTAAKERRIVIIPNLEKEKNGFVRSILLPDEEFIAYVAAPLIAQNELKGVLEIFHREPLETDEVWMDFLETLSGHAAIALNTATLFENLQLVNKNLTLAYDATLEGWAKALELRDRETENHSRRVTTLTLQLARAMEVDDEDLLHIRRGAILHDIGKLGVPDEILLKPSDLSESEWVIMKKHPQFAYDMLSPIEYLRPALDIPYCHHEKWDGSGYPRGLKGEEIPLAARIFAVVDVWDALRSERPYRKAWPENKAVQYIREQSGKYFDPQVVDAFLLLISAENIDNH